MSKDDPGSIQARLQHYFRQKTRILLAAAQGVVTQHAGLRGSHREAVIRYYLDEVVPKRFQIGRGMVYGFAHRSLESDIVIWDPYNYPNLPMADHHLFFAESTKAVLEVKTNWNSNELNDILRKSEAVRDIIPIRHALSLEDQLAMLQLEIAALKSGTEHSGLLSVGHHIATGAIVLLGGRRFSLGAAASPRLDEIDLIWPDLLLLLEAGYVVLKTYDEDSGEGVLQRINAGDDAPLVFTSQLLGLLAARSVQVEDPFYLTHYTMDLSSSLDVDELRFRLARPTASRIPLWGE